MKKLNFLLLLILTVIISSCWEVSQKTETPLVNNTNENTTEVNIENVELEEDEKDLIESLIELPNDEITQDETLDEVLSEVKQVVENDVEKTSIKPKFLTKNLSSYSFVTPVGEKVVIHPIGHATAVINWAETTFYIDPAEALEKYDWQNDPDVILITHIHGDHLKAEVLEALYKDGITVIVPESVNAELNEEMQQFTTVMAIETSIKVWDFTITTVPAYNIREEALNFHPEERNDNGYIIEKNGSRVYFAWDSEDTPEMRALENIDVAFIPMNLPYTMTAENAASAVIEFAPKVVFPYHYRGKDGITDLTVFKQIVNDSNPEINVVLHDWYGE